MCAALREMEEEGAVPQLSPRGSVVAASSESRQQWEFARCVINH